MTRATLTVAVGGRGAAPVGACFDLMPHEVNWIGGPPESVVVNGPMMELIEHTQRWWVRQFDAEIEVDGVEVTGDFALQTGQRIAERHDDSKREFPDPFGLFKHLPLPPKPTLQFDLVTAPPLERVARLGNRVLFDCAGAAGPGRWWSVGKTDAGVDEALVCGARFERDGTDLVTDDADGQRENDARALPLPIARFEDAQTHWRVYRGVPRGVSVRALLFDGHQLEPELRVALVHELALRLTGSPPGVGVDESAVWFSFDGSIHLMPPIEESRGDDGSSLLFGLWSSLPASLRPPDLFQAQATPAQIARATAAVATRIRPVDLEHELRSIVRGLFPDEWRAEQELAEQLALLDVKGFDALAARAPTIASLDR